MRITTNAIIKRYTANINNSYALLNKYNDQVSSGRKFTKASEDAASAIKSMRVRRDMSRLEVYQKNITDAKGKLSEIESALSDMKDIVDESFTTVQQGINGTMSEQNRIIIANLIDNLKDQVLKTGNSTFAGKYIFGGTNTQEPPFTLNAGGTLLYNGSDVNALIATNEQIYTDMGLGLQLDGTGAVIPGSAFSTTFPGNIVMGSGTDASGVPNNIYELLSDISDGFRNNDMTNMDAYMKKLSSSSSHLMNEITSAGEKSSFLEYLSDRYDSKNINYESRKAGLESIDSVEAIINFKTQEMAYQAALQMGTRLIQKSLMDYLG